MEYVEFACVMSARGLTRSIRRWRWWRRRCHRRFAPFAHGTLTVHASATPEGVVLAHEGLAKPRVARRIQWTVPAVANKVVVGIEVGALRLDAQVGEDVSTAGAQRRRQRWRWRRWRRRR